MPIAAVSTPYQNHVVFPLPFHITKVVYCKLFFNKFRVFKRREIVMKTAEVKWPATRETVKVDPKAKGMTTAEYIRYRCKDKRSMLKFFAEAGLTYDKNGNPVVVPR